MRNMSALVVSMVVHIIFLGSMYFVKWSLTDPNAQMMIETFFNDEVPPEVLNQQLTLNTEVSQTLSFQAGGMVTTEVGGSSSAAVAQTKIEQSESLKDPEVAINVGAVSMPGLTSLTEDMGEAQINGETGSRVEGYGAAMGRITQEILRMMKKQPVHVIWLFDESESMEDDRKEIAEQFHKIYEELRIADKMGVTKKNTPDPILTSIMGYGDVVNEITTAPTADVKTIQGSIAKVQVDKSGKENMMNSILQTMAKYGDLSVRQHRKLAIVVVSDESGDDGDRIEEVIEQTKRRKVPVFIMSRESVFGFPYDREKWTDKETGLSYPIQVHRGPESPMPECLQYDGMHERWDSFSAGFGPYEMTRLARESGGIFFMLASKQERLWNLGSKDLPRVFDQIAMKEYEPDLEARRDYEKQRATSKFRTGLWNVILDLNPYQHEEIKLRRLWYQFEPEKFKEEGAKNFQRGVQVMVKLNQDIDALSKIRTERAKESSMRWRASYDLAYGQLLAYRVRMFQTLLALDNHARNPPKVKDPKSNRWSLRGVQSAEKPTEEQIKLTKVDTTELKKQEDEAREVLKKVMVDHPGTPWALRADYELKQGFGIHMVEDYVDPRYDDPAIRARMPKF
jgi:hypothetical protein